MSNPEFSFHYQQRLEYSTWNPESTAWSSESNKNVNPSNILRNKPFDRNWN